MYKSTQIANVFLQFAKEEDQQLKVMKLLKLVYIAHGYFLGHVKKPLIKDRIEAWQYGPVIPNLYHEIRAFKGDPIPLDQFIKEEKVDEVVMGFLRIVWKHYKKFTGIQLSDKTHEKGTPWDEAYNHGVRYIEIENERIQYYYENALTPK
ncbi:MAG: Panacea domain-containing protein [Flavobacteriales bacterium]